MRTRYRISVGGKYLDAIDSRIVTTDIQHSAPEFARTVDVPGGSDGGVITRTYREKASVSVTFMLRIYSITERDEVMQEIKTWAKAGGTLLTNDRSGKRLYNVVCDQFPEVTSVRNWLDPITIVFSAYRVPYWQDSTVTTVTLSGTNASGKMTVPGNASQAYVSATITAKAAVTWFEIKTGSTTIKITANIAKDDVVEISYGTSHEITIKNGKTSLLSGRSPESADNLLLPCGKESSISIKADKKVSCQFKARGVWI